MSHVQCPICGKYSSVGLFDPSNFEDDILIVKFRGLGRGKGFEIADKYSLLDGSDPDLLDLISERVAVIYEMLFEDVEDDDEAEDEEDDDEAEDEEDEVEFESLRELDKELLLEEARAEEEDDDEYHAQPMTAREIDLQIEERMLQIEEEAEKAEDEDISDVEE